MDIQTLKRLLSFCRPYLKYLYMALLFSVCQITFTLLTPVLIGQAIDQIIGVGQVNFHNLTYQLLWIALCVLCNALFTWLLMRVSNKMNYAITNDLRHHLFAKYSSLPLSYIDSHQKNHCIICNQNV